MSKITVNKNDPSYAKLKSFISELDYDLLDQESLLYRNTRNVVYEIVDPFTQRELILKRSRPSDRYTVDRRISHYLRNFFKNYGRKAFYGALVLTKHNVPTIKPVAFWKIKVGFLQYESCFLYEKIEADYSILDFLKNMSSDESDLILKEELLDDMCSLMRKMHKQDILHRDMIVNNFLVKEEDEEGGGRKFFVIDTDHVGYNYLPTSFLKRFIAIRCMCRMSFSEEGKESFLKRYLQDAYHPFWFKVLHFWSFWDRRPLRKIRWRIKELCGLKASKA